MWLWPRCREVRLCPLCTAMNLSAAIHSFQLIRNVGFDVLDILHWLALLFLMFFDETSASKTITMSLWVLNPENAVDRTPSAGTSWLSFKLTIHTVATLSNCACAGLLSVGDGPHVYKLEGSGKK